MSATVGHDAASMAGWVRQWEELAANALEPNPFYEWWALLPALQSRPDPGFRCLLVWRAQPNGESVLAGLFPFTIVRRFKRLPLSVLASWRHESCLLCTPLVRADAAAAAIRAMLGWLQNNDDGASLAQFRYIPADGAYSACLAGALRATGSRMMAIDVFPRALLRKAADGQTYLAGALSSKARKDLRRKERRLQEQGRLEHVVLAAGADAQRWIADFLRLEAGGWKGERGSALACTEGNRRFATAMLGEAHRRGRLQMVGLDFDGRPVARCCNLVAGNGSYAYRTAYDESFAQYSPGVIAELDSIHAFHRLPGVEWMDSVTERGNTTLNRLWRDRCRVQNALVGAGGWGALWLSLLTVLRRVVSALRAAGRRLHPPRPAC